MYFSTLPESEGFRTIWTHFVAGAWWIFCYSPGNFWCWAQSAFSRCCQCSKVQIFCLIVVPPHCLDYLDRLFWLSMSPKSSHYTERGSSKESSLEILPNHVRHASTVSCVPTLVTWWKERDRGAGPIYILCWRINANQLVLRFLLQAPLMHQ